VFRGQKAVYLGPGKAFIDEEGHTFPRGLEVDVCTDTADKLSGAPYAGSFRVRESGSDGKGSIEAAVSSSCDPATGCC
jgi:hypothetical protein